MRGYAIISVVSILGIGIGLPAVVLQKIIKIGLILAGGFLAGKSMKILSRQIRKIISLQGSLSQKKQQKRLKTINGLVVTSSRLVINFVVILLLLSELGINIAPLIAGAGIAGLAVGFGAKTLVADLIGGFFILLEGHFNIGDRVQIDKYTGVVKRISLRTTMLKDEEGKTYIVPNSAIKTIIRLPKKIRQKKN